MAASSVSARARAAGSISASTIFIPAPAARRATASPIPLAAPVMTATLSSSVSTLRPFGWPNRGPGADPAAGQPSPRSVGHRRRSVAAVRARSETPSSGRYREAVRLPDEVTTPATVVDVDRLEANLVAMARRTSHAGLGLRPHAKTHKCLPVAHRQLALGAVGLSVATVAEAEAFAGAGVDDVFIAYPVLATGTRAHRLADLAERVRLTVGVDSPAGAENLARAVGRAALTVLIEVDSGHHRSGVRPDRAAGVAVAARRAGLAVAGVFTFPGHCYRPGAVERAALDEDWALDRAAAGLEAAGMPAPVRSGGSTPTVARALSRAATEVRPGVYATNDAQQLALGTCTEADVALVVVASVVSVPAVDRVVLDAGSKVLGADRPDWVPGFGRVAGVPTAVIGQLSEHHAVVSWPAEGPDRPAVGDRLAVIPNHVCSAVNLVDELMVVSRGIEVDRWPVAARGANH